MLNAVLQLSPNELDEKINCLLDIKTIDFESFHWIKGVYYKIPICCIIQFINEQDLLSAQIRDLKYPKLNITSMGYIPCDKCCEKMINKL